jgi:hypothetical protein
MAAWNAAPIIEFRFPASVLAVNQPQVDPEPSISSEKFGALSLYVYTRQPFLHINAFKWPKWCAIGIQRVQGVWGKGGAGDKGGCMGGLVGGGLSKGITQMGERLGKMMTQSIYNGCLHCFAF